MPGILSRPSWNGAKNMTANARDSLKLLAHFLCRQKVIHMTKFEKKTKDKALRKKTATKAKEILHSVAMVMSGRNTISVLNGWSCFVRLALVIFSVAEMIS